MIVEIKKIGINGEGIAYLNKQPVFIQGALIGEKVDISIIETYKNYKVARLNRIINKSEDRVIPACKDYKNCNACNLMHTNYDNQLRIKKDLVEEALLKYADIFEDIEMVASPKTINYRNSLKLPFVYRKGKLSLGIYEENSNNICLIDSCLIHTELLEKLKEKVLDILNKYKLKAYDHRLKHGLRTLVLREISNRAHMCLITGNDVIDTKIIEELSSIKEIVSIYQCINTSKSSVNLFSNKMLHLSGGKHLSFKIDNLKFNSSIKSFYQLNTNQAKNLYHYVSSLIKDDQELIVEAYSGIGAMSLLNASKAKAIIGIENVDDAVVNANVNAKINHIENVKFLVGDAAQVLLSNFKNRSIDTLIVDPPRSGLDNNMINALNRINIKNIIYVSCNPATLAKNINILKDRYNVKSIKCFDMFPNTSHVESVVQLQRK